MTLRTLNYGNYGIFLIMGHAGFCPSTVGLRRVQGRYRVVRMALALRAKLAFARSRIRTRRTSSSRGAGGFLNLIITDDASTVIAYNGMW